ncbi:hypothetical protein BDZ89DRAFT_1071650 [Hymenopellis radicata]|nr:hypothetical protein BDZ89DRAFT_1071650 [Hymenopellis radicata]
MHPTFYSNSSSLANALGGMQPSRETQFALAPTNPSANSVHYPRAENYPTERAFPMPPVGGGAPALAHPTQPRQHPHRIIRLANLRCRTTEAERSIFDTNTYYLNPMLETTSTRPSHITNLLSPLVFIPRHPTRLARIAVTRSLSPCHKVLYPQPSFKFKGRTVSQPSQARCSWRRPRLHARQDLVHQAFPFIHLVNSRLLLLPFRFNGRRACPLNHRRCALLLRALQQLNPQARRALQGTSSRLRPRLHARHQFAAPPAPTAVQRTQSLPTQPPQMRPVGTRAPVGPSPLQQSMTTPADLSSNPYAYMLSKPRQPATSNAQQVNVPRPPPQLRRSATEPITGKRRHDEGKDEEEKRQAKKAKVVSESEMTPKVPQTKHLETIEEAGEVQETGIPQENETVLPDSDQNEIVTETSSVEASSPPRCIDDYVVLRRYDLLLYAAGLHEPKLLHGDVLFGLPPQLPIHSLEIAVIVRALGESDLGVGSLKALSPDEANTTIVGWWGLLEDMKEDGIWPHDCPTYYPVPLDDKQPVGGQGRRALSADDPSPVSSSMETAHELSDESERVKRTRRISQRMRRKRR